MESYKLFATAIDPVYIGTGGYTIGRVDNTIVRDQITRLPKIPGTSLAGTWRYYTALKLHAYLRKDLLNRSAVPDWVKNWEGNKFASVECAGQDVGREAEAEDDYFPSGHCTKCLVCQSFGFSKKRKSQQGRAYFSDLHILLFPVSTVFGVKWITSPKILAEAFLEIDFSHFQIDAEQALGLVREQEEASFINFGWIRLRKSEMSSDFLKSVLEKRLTKLHIKPQDVYILSDTIISQIVNANLEVRTSVSIDPLTGAAKSGALFTTEAVPRATVFLGEIRIHEGFATKDSETDKNLESSLILSALKESAAFYESLGIGGMVTRGFGRIRIVWDEGENANA